MAFTNQTECSQQFMQQKLKYRRGKLNELKNELNEREKKNDKLNCMRGVS